MSGGHFDYQYTRIDSLADDIEREYLRDFKYKYTDWSTPAPPFGERPDTEYDRMSDATPEQREIILAEVKSLLKDLRYNAKRAKELEWYLSGDTGATSYLERLTPIKQEYDKET